MGEQPIDLRLLEGAGAWRLAEALADQLMPPAAERWDPDGGLAVGAFEGEALVGASRAEIGPDDAAPRRVTGERWRVSHLAQDPAASERGLIDHLMLVQRQQALSLGLQLVTWAQDPFDLRLAHLAMRRLGAVSRWIRNGEGGGPPRLEVEWWIHSPRVRALLAGSRPRLELVDALEAGAPKLNAGELRADDLLWPIDDGLAPEGAMALVEIPAAFGQLQVRDASLATAWRQQIERLLSQAFARGYWLTDFLELRGERQPRAYYLLIDGERTLS